MRLPVLLKAVTFAALADHAAKLAAVIGLKLALRRLREGAVRRRWGLENYTILL